MALVTQSSSSPNPTSQCVNATIEQRDPSMASYSTLPPTPLSHLTSKRSHPNTSLITIPLFDGGFSAKFHQRPRVLVPVVRSSLGGSDLPSDLKLGGGRSSWEYWKQREVQDGESAEAVDIISSEELHQMMSLVASIMSFISVHGDPNKGVERKKHDLVLHCLQYHGGIVVPAGTTHHRHLFRMIEEYIDNLEENRRDREERQFQEMSMAFKLVGLIRKFFSWFAKGVKDFFSFSWLPPVREVDFGFGFGCLLCAICVVFYVFVLPGALIWSIFARKPDLPPPPPPPIPSATVTTPPNKFLIGLGIVSSVISVLGKLLPFFPTQM